ncbi:hypothetical protein E2I00_015855 [Balaenoptera physalus]|uniref:Nesprin-3 n=1 Tax=Balaenoptera physalus TaxID=9770 RepID=A0A6A1Q5B6_BALPH|nr:hypothetical protein E2I00_015855 [Balaenoptera physalus]
MTQQPQEGFARSLEDAQEWMKAVQERLQVNDNTQGPRAALEARLRETEKICQLEPEGRLKVDMVLRAAEALLACCHEDQKPEILARLRDVKAQWEETVTYMTHCHSRIEWVWLHWSEYLLARDEFYRWFQKMTVVLEPPVELQLGLKEKRWQLSHAQNRVDLLEHVTQEHEHFQVSVDEFQLWLKAVVERVHGCMGRKCQLSTKDRLSALQDIASDFPRGEASLKSLEEQAVGVIQNTSPWGAEKITKELEEMRNVLEKLRALWEEEEGRLQGLLKSRGAYEQQRRQLEAELAEFRKGLQRLAEEDLEPAAKAGTEDELVARWRLYSATRAALAAEEPRGDRLQARLQELIVFPQDPQPLADSVVAAIQEHQSLKAKTTRLRNAAGTDLWQHFQRPLQELQLWRALAQRLLDVTASLPDLPSIHTFLPQIEAALAESSRLKEQLTMLQLKKDLLGGIFGQERATALLEQVATSVRDRDLLHNRLLQRKSKLQSSLAQHKDFGAAFDPLQRRLSDLQIRVHAENGLQRDLPGKQAQLSRLQGLQEEGLDLGVQVEAMRPLVQGNSHHQHRMDQLSSDHQILHRSLEDLVDTCQQSVREHCTFSHELLELRQWISVLTQKLEAHRGDTGPWDAQSREVEVEDLTLCVCVCVCVLQKLLDEFPGKEAQLPLIEAHGRLVMEKSSPEGAAVVQKELQELVESWGALRLLGESLLRCLLSPFGHPQLHPSAQMESPGLVASGLFSETLMHWSCCAFPQATVRQEEEGSCEDFSQLLRNFEQWLQVDNSKLVRIIATRTATATDLRTRETELQELEARLPEGQRLFENVLRLRPARGSSEKLEDLRYRWMLYKSKLKDSGHLLVGARDAQVPGPGET